MTPVLGDPKVTAFLRALSLHWFCSTCTPNDLPVTRGRKFIYADDICLAIQGQFFSELECRLSSDMVRMSHFCRQWRLKPSASKTEKRGVFAFHYLLTFLHDAYSGINGLLTPFVGVECNCGSTTVLGSHAKKINIDITELLYR